MKRICQVYRSPHKAEMYLYVDKSEGLQRVPEALLARFGDPRPVLVLALDTDRRLARANAADVLAAIDSHGFYLQLPPTEEELRRRERVDG